MYSQDFLGAGETEKSRQCQQTHRGGFLNFEKSQTPPG
jgi:hypothetical protein